MKLLNFLNFHSIDSIFVTETWLYPEIEHSELFPRNFNYPIIARRDRSGGEHDGVLIAAKKDFSFNYSELTLKIDQNLRIGLINDFAVAVSIVSIQSSHMFLLIYNPPSALLYRIEGKLLADRISSCHAKFVDNVPNSFSILVDLNLNDVCWATVIGHSGYSKKFLLQTQQFNLNPFVNEPTCKSDSTLDVILASDSELFNVHVDSHLHSDHYPVFALLDLPISSSESATNMTNNCSLSFISSTHFNSHSSTGFNTLMAQLNCSFTDVYKEESSSMRQQTLMDALNKSCKINISPLLQILYCYFSYSIHLLNKLRRLKNVTKEMVQLKGYNRKLVCLLNWTNYSSSKICPPTPFVLASSFYIFFRQIVHQIN